LESVETIREDGLISGIDEGERIASGNVDIRFGGVNPLEALAASKTPAAMVLRFSLASHPEFWLELQLPRVFFFNPKKPITGPGGIAQSWQWRAARDAGLGYMLAAVLRNDVEDYD